ncbi:hypothetical protein Ahy_B05g079005 [Arachis hypogaea]|uniref:Ribonuclease H n=1 Tax=Arachis hypogaea TaxID=3818 RepID=A0A444Z8S4_ARAHY|nr:hypothetical protein Ahy_B05g079005 [Arachis hypogaea]
MEGGRHNYYVVRKGRVPGIYTNWVDCERQVSGFKGNEYKGFQVRREAVEWLNSGGDNSGEHDDDRGGGGQPSNDNRGTLSSYFRARTCKLKLMDVAITQSLNQRSNWLSYVKLDLVPEKSKEGIELYCTFLTMTLAQELKLLMEVTMTRHAKSTETDPSTDEQQAMESGIDKDGTQ